MRLLYDSIQNRCVFTRYCVGRAGGSEFYAWKPLSVQGLRDLVPKGIARVLWAETVYVFHRCVNAPKGIARVLWAETFSLFMFNLELPKGIARVLWAETLLDHPSTSWIFPKGIARVLWAETKDQSDRGSKARKG